MSSPPPPPPTGAVTGALAAAAAGLAEQAVHTRRLAAELALAAAAEGWCSTAAQACRDRLTATGLEILAAGRLLEQAADLVADHSRVAAHRAAVLHDAAAEVAGGVLGGAGALVVEVVT